MSHSTLGNGEWLKTGTSLFSENGKFELRMQDDGKLAIYKDGEFVWQTSPDQDWNTEGARMQADGNLVIYDKSDKAIWHTDTAGSTGDSTVICVMQNDGNMVLYRGSPIWASNTGE
ncbi:Mannose-specific lectin [Escovopsis weberi]|uniref:Mannose-specific lectin n=1 Tax=Escovopsis weberi TaxID=150374 RepID=A0A0M8MYY7_ESCWE|nr:Mannose-specific lectin [Escovopsis weberi]